MTLLNLYIFEKVSHMHLFSVTDLCETIPFLISLYQNDVAPHKNNIAQELAEYMSGSQACFGIVRIVQEEVDPFDLL